MLLQNLKVFATTLKVVYYKTLKLFSTKSLQTPKVVYYKTLKLFTTRPQSCLLQNLKVVYYKTENVLLQKKCLLHNLKVV